MADLLYFIPGKATIKRDDLVSAGAAHALPDGKAGIHHAQMDAGPSGGRGVVGTVSNGNLQAADTHEWTQFPGVQLWVGFNPKDPPTPADLARKSQMQGHAVTLEDGAAWLIPVARMITGATPLPRRLGWNGKTWTPGDVLPQFRDLFASACRFWDAFISAEADASTSISFDDEVHMAAEALAVNYRLSPVEITLLGLFSTQTEAEICKAVIDWPAFEAIKKKLEVDAQSSQPGDED